MGLFGKFFDKKVCSICGEEIGLLGNRKLEDGNCCKNCASKLSPFFSERRHSTVDEIRQQLEYREANRKDVEAFNVTRTIDGSYSDILVDEDAGKFLIAKSKKWREENPDVIAFSQVTGCETSVKELKTEEKKKTEDGKYESYDPPVYSYDFDFYATIHVNSPYFDEITLKMNSDSVTSRGSQAYRDNNAKLAEVKELFTGAREAVRANIESEKAPKTVVRCPHCGGNTTPDAEGRCEWCGSPVFGK